MSSYHIYPKQFRNAKIPVEKNTCFFLMPFHKDFDYTYCVLKKELTENGVICQRVDEISGSTPIINKILSEILRSQYIIVDLTNYNPNVFYELGVAHTFKDARNIMLIKQKEQKVPFDISHLTYIEYDPLNLKLLTSTIKRFISDNKLATDFYDALNLCGLISIVNVNENQYIEYLQNQLGATLPVAIALLNGRYSEINENEVENLLNTFNYIINQMLKEKNYEMVKNILGIYFEVTAAAPFAITDRYIMSFFDSEYQAYGIHENESLAWKTDFAVLLASKNKKMYLTLSWIINYFSRSKSATIDLNRHKLEGFLLTSSLKEVNDAMTGALHNRNCYIREHMADIIGEKHLQSALSSLFVQLGVENNYFTASSLISAIGKLNNTEGISHIVGWVDNNYDEIYQTKQFFVLRRALMAISTLDNSPNTEHINAFQDKHGKILKDYFII